MNKPAPPQHTTLVAEAMLAMKKRDDALAELRAIEEKLISFGAGKYTDDDGHIAQVIGEVLSTSVPESKEPDSYSLESKEAEDRAREIAGDDFRKLFDRHVYFTPCEGFEAVAPKILTPAKARDIIALCLVPGNVIPGRVISGKRAHVRWSVVEALVPSACYFQAADTAASTSWPR